MFSIQIENSNLYTKKTPMHFLLNGQYLMRLIRPFHKKATGSPVQFEIDGTGMYYTKYYFIHLMVKDYKNDLTKEEQITLRQILRNNPEACEINKQFLLLVNPQDLSKKYQVGSPLELRNEDLKYIDEQVKLIDVESKDGKERILNLILQRKTEIITIQDNEVLKRI
jgi:hypothetical protein